MVGEKVEGGNMVGGKKVEVGPIVEGISRRLFIAITKISLLNRFSYNKNNLILTQLDFQYQKHGNYVALHDYIHHKGHRTKSL